MAGNLLLEKEETKKMFPRKDWGREGRKEANPLQAEEATKAQRRELEMG